MHKTLILKFAVFLISVVMLVIGSSCDRNSAVDTDEYSHERNKLDPAQIVRVTIYFLPHANKNKMWKEASLKRMGVYSKNFSGEQAIEMWRDVRYDHDSQRNQDPSKWEKIYFGFVAETSSGMKYFAILERLFNDNGTRFLAVDGYGDDNWWMEAKSEAWNDVLTDNSRSPTK